MAPRSASRIAARRDTTSKMPHLTNQSHSWATKREPRPAISRETSTSSGVSIRWSSAHAMGKSYKKGSGKERPAMPVHTEQRERWEELTDLLNRVDRQGVEALSAPELKRLCQLYRHVAMDLSRARTDGADPELVGYLNYLAARAHGCVYRTSGVDVRPLLRFMVSGFPRLVAAHVRPILVASAAFLLTSLASFLAVVRQPELAFSLFDERIVE